MPTSNNEMTYNQTYHRYVLTQSYVRQSLNIDLTSELNTSDAADIGPAAERFLERVSALVYGWIYSVNPLRYRTERALALTDAYRPFIRDAMKEQLLYILNNGDLSALSGVNIDSGMVIDERILKSARISPIAKEILINADIVKAYIPLYEREIVPNYTGENY